MERTLTFTRSYKVLLSLLTCLQLPTLLSGQTVPTIKDIPGGNNNDLKGSFEALEGYIRMIETSTDINDKFRDKTRGNQEGFGISEVGPEAGFFVTEEYEGFSETPLLLHPTEDTDDWKMEADDEEGCRCNSDEDLLCVGTQGIPQVINCNLLSNPQTLRLFLVSNTMQSLMKSDLEGYSDRLQDLNLERPKLLTTIEGGVFDGFKRLRTVYIKQAPKLTEIGKNVFRGIFPDLKKISIVQTGLRKIPDTKGLEPGQFFSIDLDNNEIEMVDTCAFRVKAESVNLEYNKIEVIRNLAFNGSRIAKLSFKGNRQLKLIEPNAFLNIESLRRLDLSETSITRLPTNGLESLEILKVASTYTLKVFPSVYHFKSIKEAKLTYPYHCCAFKFPQTHHPEEYAKFQETTIKCSEGKTTSQVTKTQPVIYSPVTQPTNKVREHNEVELSDSEQRMYSDSWPFPNGPVRHKDPTLAKVFHSKDVSKIHARDLRFHEQRGGVRMEEDDRSFILDTNFLSAKAIRSFWSFVIRQLKKYSYYESDEAEASLAHPQATSSSTNVPNTQEGEIRVTTIKGRPHRSLESARLWNESGTGTVDKSSEFAQFVYKERNGYHKNESNIDKVWEKMKEEREGFGVYENDFFPNENVKVSRTNFDDGIFHSSVAPSYNVVFICGEIAKNYREVQCSPEPDAFNPCEDVMGNSFLRVVVWFVVVAAVFGNLAVMVVLMSSRFTMSVSKFLMCNLAFADLCMGLYLLVIAVVDLHTVGVYFNWAIDWQQGVGCQAAGFLTVFGSELSIFTLTVITLERWYAITYAIHLHKRLKLGVAVKVMAVGWFYALTMATLPLVGVSGYARTSICLPMENSDTSDLAFLLTLLTTNGLAFLLVCACYGKMYLKIGGRHRVAQQTRAAAADTTVAKRMAMLVFTDFACWAPIAFFGITAVAGYPLISVTNSKILLVFFYPLNSCANPFLYAIMTKQYRRDFFILASRYGFCTQRASKYKGTYSCNTTTNRALSLRTNCHVSASGYPSNGVLLKDSGLSMGRNNVAKKSNFVNHLSSPNLCHRVDAEKNKHMYDELRLNLYGDGLPSGRCRYRLNPHSHSRHHAHKRHHRSRYTNSEYVTSDSKEDEYYSEETNPAHLPSLNTIKQLHTSVDVSDLLSHSLSQTEDTLERRQKDDPISRSGASLPEKCCWCEEAMAQNKLRADFATFPVVVVFPKDSSTPALGDTPQTSKVGLVQNASDSSAETYSSFPLLKMNDEVLNYSDTNICCSQTIFGVD